MASLLLNSGENINQIKHSVKNKIFHTQDLCLRTNLRCAKDSARMEINMQKTLCHPTTILLDDREVFFNPYTASSIFSPFLLTICPS
ncbi:MAG TPA: hypothetical protein DC028_02115 [Eubacterium sp.]|nr:hypothetical protein [Eubacterium sp.]